MRVLQVGGDSYLAEKPIPTQRGGQLGPDHLDGDLAIVLQIMGQPDSGHTPAPEFALEHVPIAQGVGEE